MRAIGALAAAALALAAAPALADTGGWKNGANPQPASPMVTGPVTWTMMVDTYFGYALNAPADRMVFPTTTAPRHGEFNLNLGMIGAELTGVENAFGKLVLQHGNYVDTLVAPDPSVGPYSTLESLRHVQQAYAGARYQGLEVGMGLFPAYVGLDSYLPQENWSYTHNLLSDFTPYYLMGGFVRSTPRPDLTAEVWLANGWQTLTRSGSGLGAGYNLGWTPSEAFSLGHNVLVGEFTPGSVRYYTNNTAQWKYAERPWPGVRHMALAGALDGGYEAGANAWMGGATLMHRTQLEGPWAMTARAGVYADPQQRIAPVAPGMTLGAGELVVGELTATLDYRPSPWLVHRLELRHDMASIPYVSGPGGVSDLRNSGSRVLLNTTLRL